MKLLYLILCLCCACIWAEFKSIELEIVFPEKDRPCVYVEIEGHKFLELFDLGAIHEFAMSRSALTVLPNKEPFSKSLFRGMKGEAEENIEYFFPKISINSLVFNNAVVAELGDKRLRAEEKFVGFVGNRILQSGNLILDFARSKVIVIPHSTSQRADGYDIESWVKIKFEWKGIGIFLEIDNDMEKMRFLLDTGCVFTYIDRSFFTNPPEEQNLYYDSSKFKIGEFDFGKQRLTSMEWGKFADEQGILGMDFLKKHVIYIDYPNKVLYIKP